MREKLIWFIVGALFVSGIFWIKRTMYLIETSDPNYNTVYSSKYKEKLFNENLVGKNEIELVQLLGVPLGKYNDSFSDEVLYIDNKDSIFLSRACRCVGFKGEPQDKNYRRFWFDSTGKLVHVKTHGYNDKKKYDSLSKPAILNIFGTPDDEILSNCNCEVLSFSGLTTGTQSGKNSKRFVREVVLNKNKVAVEVIKGVTDMNNFFLYGD